MSVTREKLFEEVWAEPMPELNEAIVGTYLSGTNTRRIKGALKPLLKAAPLSKSAVSRVLDAAGRARHLAHQAAHCARAGLPSTSTPSRCACATAARW